MLPSTGGYGRIIGDVTVNRGFLGKETNMKKVNLILMVLLAAVIIAGCSPSKKLTIPERRQVVMDMEKETLNRLYAEEPATKEKIKKASGYGVFSNANVNVIFASAGGGYGIVVDNSTGKKTYMKMGMGGLGLGLGVKDYRVVLIFKTKEIVSKFIESGWEFGGHADAAAKAGEKGGELSGEGDVHSDIEVYSMTESGLALQATVTGTKYWKDDDLN